MSAQFEYDSYLVSSDGRPLHPELDHLFPPRTTRELFDDEQAFKVALGEGIFRDPEAAFSHEQAHLLTALAVGISNPRYGVMRNLQTGRIEQAIVHLGSFSNVPRLALGAIAIAPIDPSWGDLDCLGRLGYRNIQGKSTRLMRDRIGAWNDTNELQIPLPHSLDYRSA